LQRQQNIFSYATKTKEAAVQASFIISQIITSSQNYLRIVCEGVYNEDTRNKLTREKKAF
jgi:hypothetical protein